LYSRKPDNPAKACKARGNNIRVHFKNTVEAATAIRGMKLRRAQKFLRNVILHREAVPFRHFTGGVGRTSQLHHVKYTSQGRWPKKSALHLLRLLKNAENSAEMKGLDAELLRITHIQVSPAPKQRRRTYRAHGRINPFMSNPCHIQIILTEKDKEIPAAKKGDKVVAEGGVEKDEKKKLRKGRKNTPTKKWLQKRKAYKATRDAKKGKKEAITTPSS